MSEINWLDKIHSGQHIITNVQDSLFGLAKRLEAAYQVGLAEEIHFFAKQCEKVHDLIHGGVGENISEGLKTSQDNTALLLKVTLAGALVGQKSKGKIDPTLKKIAKNCIEND